MGSEKQMPQRNAARGTIQLGVGQGFQMVFGYLIIVLLARGLGPVSYGIYGVIMSVLLWVEQTSRLSVPSATAKLIAEDNERSQLVEETSIVVCFTFSFVAMVIIWLIAPILARIFHVINGAWFFRLAVIDIPLYGLYFAYRGISEGRRNFATLSAGGVIYALSKFLGVLCLLLVGFSVSRALIVNIVGSVIGFLFFAYRMRVKLLSYHQIMLAPILRLAFPLAIGGLGLGLVYTFDLWALKVISPEIEPKIIGIYVAATQVARLPQFGVIGVALVLFPSIARAQALKDISLGRRYVEGAVRFLWVILLPISVLIAFESEDIMTLIFSSQYTGGGSILSLLIIGLSLFSFLTAFVTVLQARGDIYLSAGIVGGLLVIMFTLSVFLIPKFGHLGAASALTVTNCVGTFVTGFLVYRCFGSLIKTSTLINVIVATTVMTLVSMLVAISGILLLIKFSVLIILYALVLALLGELKREDLQPLLIWRRKKVSG